MKNLILSAITFVALTGMVIAQNGKQTLKVDNVQPTKTAACKWEKTNFDFGTIPQGKPVSVVFNFTNSGSAPLILTSVNPSCGCTTEDYTKEVIAPGKSGFVKLTYNAAAVGAFNKTTTVNTNADPTTFTLTFNGNVAVVETPAP